MRIFRFAESESKSGAGYTANYVADIDFRKSVETAGAIIVKIPRNTKTTPHSHIILEEVFIVMNRTRMGVGKQIINLEAGDVVVAEPHEEHWFETYKDEDVTVIALKVPNLKDDKITT